VAEDEQVARARGPDQPGRDLSHLRRGEELELGSVVADLTRPGPVQRMGEAEADAAGLLGEEVAVGPAVGVTWQRWLRSARRPAEIPVKPGQYRRAGQGLKSP
jgi:hypothetical protein